MLKVFYTRIEIFFFFAQFLNSLWSIKLFLCGKRLVSETEEISRLTRKSFQSWSCINYKNKLLFLTIFSKLVQLLLGRMSI